jgi:hypothetical protein
MSTSFHTIFAVDAHLAKGQLMRTNSKQRKISEVTKMNANNNNNNNNNNTGM